MWYPSYYAYTEQILATADRISTVCTNDCILLLNSYLSFMSNISVAFGTTYFPSALIGQLDTPRGYGPSLDYYQEQERLPSIRRS